MEELLLKLVESEVLTEDTKNEITTAINEAIESQVEERLAVSVKAEKEQLREAFKAERESLVESLDAFIKENMEGAHAKRLDEQYQSKFEEERSNLVENISTFLEMELSKKSPRSKSKHNAMHEAFYNTVKKIVLDEQEVDEKVAQSVRSLQEALKKKDERISSLYGQLVESKRKEAAKVLESKIEDTLRLIPADKRSLAKRLFEGVTEEKFDVVAKQVMSELVESVDSKESNSSEQHSEKEVVTEGVETKSFDEVARARQLAGIK